jgi:hypothetical protein
MSDHSLRLTKAPRAIVDAGGLGHTRRTLAGQLRGTANRLAHSRICHLVTGVLPTDAGSRCAAIRSLGRPHCGLVELVLRTRPPCAVDELINLPSWGAQAINDVVLNQGRLRSPNNGTICTIVGGSGIVPPLSHQDVTLYIAVAHHDEEGAAIEAASWRTEKPGLLIRYKYRQFFSMDLPFTDRVRWTSTAPFH